MRRTRHRRRRNHKGGAKTRRRGGQKRSRKTYLPAAELEMPPPELTPEQRQLMQDFEAQFNMLNANIAQPDVLLAKKLKLQKSLYLLNVAKQLFDEQLLLLEREKNKGTMTTDEYNNKQKLINMRFYNALHREEIHEQRRKQSPPPPPPKPLMSNKSSKSVIDKRIDLREAIAAATTTEEKAALQRQLNILNRADDTRQQQLEELKLKMATMTPAEIRREKGRISDRFYEVTHRDTRKSWFKQQYAKKHATSPTNSLLNALSQQKPPKRTYQTKRAELLEAIDAATTAEQQAALQQELNILDTAKQLQMQQHAELNQKKSTMTDEEFQREKGRINYLFYKTTTNEHAKKRARTATPVDSGSDQLGNMDDLDLHELDLELFDDI